MPRTSGPMSKLLAGPHTVPPFVFYGAVKCLLVAEAVAADLYGHFPLTQHQPRPLGLQEPSQRLPVMLGGPFSSEEKTRERK